VKTLDETTKRSRCELAKWGHVLLIGLALVSPSTAVAAVQYVYDAAGRLTVVYAPSGDAAQYVYDAAGNITQINRFSAGNLSVIQFTPEIGAVGSSVTVYGTGFNPISSANTVKFNGTTAAVVSGSTMQLVVSVPAGATTGPISVTNGANTATSSRNFTVGQILAAPAISGFAPTIGTAGTAVTISGVNFDPQTSHDVVRFNNAMGVASGATTTSISTSVPTGATSGRISVSTSQGSALSTNDFFVPPSPNTAADVAATGRIAIDGGPLPISITSSGKIALVVFDGIAGQTLGLGVSAVTFPSGSTASISILNPDGTTLLAASNFTAGTSRDLPVLPASGTYTIKVAPNSGTQVNFTLTLSSDLTGTLSGNGSSVTFNTGRVGQNGRYTFNATAGAVFGVFITDDTVASATIELRRPNGTVLASTTVGTSGGQIPVQALPDTGTYTLFVNPAADNVGNMTLTLGAPDLAISNLVVGTITSKPGGGYLIPITYTVTNVGTSNAKASWYDFGYLSTDGTLDNSDIGMTAYNTRTTDLGPGASYTTSLTLVVPSTVTAGSYTLFVKTDGRSPSFVGGSNTDNGALIEISESNNIASAAVQLDVDLVISNLTVGTITSKSGGGFYIPVTYTVTNHGTATAKANWYDFGYLSTDGTLDNSDVGMAPYNTNTTDLGPGASYTASLTLVTPSSTTPGDYTVFVKADGRSPTYVGGSNTDNGGVTEVNETNNVASAVVHLDVDLAVSNLTVGTITSKQGGGFYIPVTYTVTNLRTATAKANWYDFGYLSTDGTFDNSDAAMLPYNQRTTDLAGGANYTVSSTLIAPATTTAGTYTLFVKTDGHAPGYTIGTNTDSGSVIEVSETNNVASATVQLDVDLAISNLVVGTITTKPGGGYYIPITYTVTNLGTATAKATWYDFGYLSSDGTFDNSDIGMYPYNTRSADLAGGASYTASLTLTTPSSTTAGSYTLFVKTDGHAPAYISGTNMDNGNVTEVSETNNLLSTTVTLP
jgi:YD repeat-containing protein